MIKFKRKPKFNIEGYMFVDPGFFTGITYWPTMKKYYTKEINLKGKVNKEAFIKYKHICLWEQFDKILKDYNPQCVMFEDVTIRKDEQSLKAALSGNILKLDRLLGGYQAACLFNHIPYSTRKVIEWKGNMSDEQVQRRIEWLTGLEFDSPHVADSFGISLNEMGIFR